MKMQASWRALTCGVVLISSFAVPAKALAAMRCHSRLISVGDTSLSLEQKCGAADFVTTQPVANTTSAVGTALLGGTTRTFETVETRVYRGDPGQMARFVELRRGIIVAIRLVHVATVDDPVGCQKVLDTKDPVGKVQLACGSPFDATQWLEERTALVNGLQVSEVVNYERWFYDLGEGRFERILTFENGALVSIEAGRRH